MTAASAEASASVHRVVLARVGIARSAKSTLHAIVRAQGTASEFAKRCWAMVAPNSTAHQSATTRWDEVRRFVVTSAQSMTGSA